VTALSRHHLLEQLTERLRRRGLAHPDAAAAALAARGATRLDRARYARRLGLDPDLVARAEAGEVPLDRLPAALRPPPDP
jgi:hypothetical protein